MMRSLYSAVSGLKGHQTRMDVIGNNIANVNTTGFKSGRVNFEDMISQTLSSASSATDEIGGTNPKQIGLGVGVGSIDTLFTDGTTQSTGKNTDLALSGNGLFVVKKGSETYYTRDGAFQFDADGNYVLPSSGLYVQGWNAVDGVLTTNGATENIVVQSGKSMSPEATGIITYANNLNAAMPTITSMSGGTTTTTTSGTSTVTTYTASTTKPVILTMSDGTTVTETSGKYVVGQSLPVTTMVTAYDTLGNSHSIPIYFTKTKTDSTNGNSWTVSVNTDGSGSSTISEDDGTNTTVAMADATINFTTSGKYNSGSPQTVTLTLTNGSEGTQTITLNLQSLTQFSGNSTINGTSDGHSAGTLSSVSIDSSGIITGTYTNGVKQTEAQVAIAQFTNAAGLEKTGSSLYQTSNNSGTANVKTASDLGVTITPSALEMSNVDISDEFTNMIVTQRGFQSNSKIITVDDELLETVINMKR